MAFAKFSLFQSHLDLAHRYWHQLLSPGDLVIDATCGNGHDTLFLSKIALSEPRGRVLAMDIQPNAVANTRTLLQEQLPQEQYDKITFITGCHSSFPKEIIPQSVGLIVYNLGYLPGGDKALTTRTATTLASLLQACYLIRPGGAISMTCYPGHPEGKEETEAVLHFASALSPTEWSACHHQWLNRQASPQLLLLQRKIG